MHLKHRMEGYDQHAQYYTGSMVLDGSQGGLLIITGNMVKAAYFSIFVYGDIGHSTVFFQKKYFPKI